VTKKNTSTKHVTNNYLFTFYSISPVFMNSAKNCW